MPEISISLPDIADSGGGTTSYVIVVRIHFVERSMDDRFDGIERV